MNGEWKFAFDREDVGLTQKWFAGRDAWPLQIIVPYVHQSRLSGIGDTGHYRQVWYHRTFCLPTSFTGKRVRLHIGAADFRATVWINGKEVGTYEGGYTPFWFDITDLVKPSTGSENEVTIRVYDNERDPEQPRGKQHPSGKGNRWHYTHLTGIWQTVWLEAVNVATIDRYQVTSTINPPSAHFVVHTEGAPKGATVYIQLRDRQSNRRIGSGKGTVKDGKASLTVTPEAGSVKLWTPQTPILYNLTLQLQSGSETVDEVTSYIGFRTVEARDGKFFLNGTSVWLNGALDQGYYPDGLYTPPNDQAFVDDILWVKRLGLNHIRKHQMVAYPRFLYHCDRLGLLVWGEMANAGEGIGVSERSTSIALREWKRVIDRDFNHPCIVTWVYSNENWMHGGPLQGRIDHYRAAFAQMKAWDPTRPIIDTSGYYHVESDIMDTHHYPPQKRLSSLYLWAEDKFPNPSSNIVFLTDMDYKGQPIMVSEWLNRNLHNFTGDQVDRWLPGYLATLGEFASHPLCEGHCYVQLYDIENECDGYLYYDRRSKFTPRQEAILLKAHRQAEKHDLSYDWDAFINKHCLEYALFQAN